MSGRPDCEGSHGPRRVPAETWSWVFGQWLCQSCLFVRSEREMAQVPGAYLDRRPIAAREDHP